jgi:ABC-type lipoprotein release transport system permease subunit
VCVCVHGCVCGCVCVCFCFLHVERVSERVSVCGFVRDIGVSGFTCEMRERTHVSVVFAVFLMSLLRVMMIV